VTLLRLLRLGLVILVVLLLAPVPRGGAAKDAGAVEPPVAGRPANFSGAIGSGYRVAMRAVPTQLQAEDPLILTVRITGTGNLEEIHRPDLRRLPRFAGRFHIEDLAGRYLPATKTREFDYRLRPRTPAVKEIPPLPFVFFNPKILPPERGYQTSLAPAIPLSVQPRTEVRPARVEGTTPASETPASVNQLVDGPLVLRYDRPFALPGGSALAALLVGPPAFGGLWYMVWRRCYPDAVHQSRRRRSRAAQHALKALQRSSKLDAAGQAHRAEAVLTGYMRQRLDLLAVEPTPVEVARHLELAGASRALAQDVAHFFAACDAVRFAPGLMGKPENWPATAAHLVLALEEEPWPAQFS
jgi:hypothetical protein